jgi:hypothetical protein
MLPTDPRSVELCLADSLHPEVNRGPHGLWRLQCGCHPPGPPPGPFCSGEAPWTPSVSLPYNFGLPVDLGSAPLLLVLRSLVFNNILTGSPINSVFFFFYFLVILQFEFRASSLLGKSFATQPFFCVGFFPEGLANHLPGVGLEI